MLCKRPTSVKSNRPRSQLPLESVEPLIPSASANCNQAFPEKTTRRPFFAVWCSSFHLRNKLPKSHEEGGSWRTPKQVDRAQLRRFPFFVHCQALAGKSPRINEGVGKPGRSPLPHPFMCMASCCISHGQLRSAWSGRRGQVAPDFEAHSVPPLLRSAFCRPQTPTPPRGGRRRPASSGARSVALALSRPGRRLSH